jgi:hypothetical protein
VIRGSLSFAAGTAVPASFFSLRHCATAGDFCVSSWVLPMCSPMILPVPKKGRGRPVAEAPPLSDGCKPDSVQHPARAEDLDGHLSRRRGSRADAGSLRNGDQYPEGSPLARRSGRRPGPSCSVLHRMGFFVPPRLRSGRWALTPPFHPGPPACANGWFVFCDTVRRPGLSHRPPAHSTRHAALWCPDFPLHPRLAAQTERPSAIG